MLFKTLLISATAVLAAPIACEQPQEHVEANSNSNPKYSLNAILPGQGASGMKGLQIRGDDIVYGLTQGYSYFKLEAVGDNLVNVESPGQGPRELYAADNGELVINEHPAQVGKGYDGGWKFEGDGPVKSVTYYGANEWYSCTSKDDPLHGGQVVYIKKGDNYACKDPIHFTVAATKE
ncbi:YALI0C21252p [Yarrowia lipolytica CLIB122]|uniref:YALI0C21252p n=2 Tax=Yarrowia lipolytica TaxID=4952 RepID=Q6CB79_YARLI|nr:YALI0C21252p [Yarrowia lipolytica CLIB122]AOW03188.1 hypothetical protein YALI1_C29344g [Yarrowia lipolytica]KAB8281160.1 hypothetical protein BKA91DRAFT_148029 [Yarrowia lipolytica]KAE8172999.1 hypothetical protein BKA90DRAFT_81904 [Yarrowia lipolytica]KAJ8053693.1 hypothetical protein LXG23DRAFT_23864 [Yarrowia lipolytica]RMI96132.1 hypothetical protein BD777DRAFT_160169 [Yarrowia lipolytica]|eukprot:XP_502083.1 YALI0C21252p [Yarrowia lipolytica CLIB122]